MSGETSNSLMEGWITKEGGSIKTWKKRWMVLTPGRLDYFEKDEKKGKCDLKGSLAIPEISSVSEVVKYKGKRFCMAFATQKRVYYICAASLEDRSRWIALVVPLLNQQPSANKNPPKQHPDSAGPSSSSSSDPIGSADGPLVASSSTSSLPSPASLSSSPSTKPSSAPSKDTLKPSPITTTTSTTTTTTATFDSDSDCDTSLSDLSLSGPEIKREQTTTAPPSLPSRIEPATSTTPTGAAAAASSSPPTSSASSAKPQSKPTGRFMPVLPWEAENKLQLKFDIETPAEFILRKLLHDFHEATVEFTNRTLASTEPLVLDESLLGRSKQDTALLSSISILSSFSQYCLDSQIAALMSWRSQSSPMNLNPKTITGKGKPTKLVQKEVDKILLHHYIFARTLSSALATIDDLTSFVSESCSRKLCSMVFEQFMDTPKLSKTWNEQSGPNHQHVLHSFGLILRKMTGLPVMLRFISQALREQLKANAKHHTLCTNIVAAIAYFHLRIDSPDSAAASLDLVKTLSSSISEFAGSKKEQRQAFAKALSQAFASIFPQRSHSRDFQQAFAHALADLFAQAQLLCKKVGILTGHLLLSAILPLAEPSVFFRNRDPQLEALLHSSKEPAHRAACLHAIFLLSYATFYYASPDDCNPAALLGLITQHLYPIGAGKKVSYHKPTVPMYSLLVSFLYHVSTAAGNLLLSQLTIERDSLNVEGLIIGLLSFIHIDTPVDKRPDPHALLKLVESEDSRYVHQLFLREQSLPKPQYPPQPFDLEQLRPLNHSITACLLQTHAQVGAHLLTLPKHIDFSDRSSKADAYDLLRVLIHASRRTIPSKLSTAEYVTMLCQYCLHQYDGIAIEARETLVSLIESKPALRPTIVHLLCRFLSIIPLTQPTLIRTILAILVQLLQAWLSHHPLNPLAFEERVAPEKKVSLDPELNAVEVEGTLLAYLSLTDHQSRTFALQGIQATSSLAASLRVGLSETRLQTIFRSEVTACIANSYIDRSSVRSHSHTNEERAEFIENTRKMACSFTLLDLSARSGPQDDEQWSRLLGEITKIATEQCREASLVAWRIIGHRLLNLRDLFQGKQTDLLAKLMPLWRNLLTSGCACTLVAEGAYMPPSLLTETALTLPGVEQHTESTTCLTTAEFFALALPHLRHDSASFRRAAETAFAFLPWVAFGTIFTSLLPLESAAAEAEPVYEPEPEDEQKKARRAPLKKTDRLPTALSFVYRCIGQSMPSNMLHERRSDIADGLRKKVVDVLRKNVTRPLALATQEDPYSVLERRYNLCIFIKTLLDSVNKRTQEYSKQYEIVGGDQEMLLGIVRQARKKVFGDDSSLEDSVFFFLLDCCGWHPKSRTAELDQPLVAEFSREAFKTDESVRSAAFSALTAWFLTPTNAAHAEEVLNTSTNLLVHGPPEFHHIVHPLLMNIIRNNMELRVDLVSRATELSYSPDPNVCEGYFAVVVDSLEHLHVKLPTPTLLNLTIFQLSDPEPRIRNAAAQLAHAACAMYFGTDPLFHSHLDSYDAYLESQRRISRLISASHPDLAIAFFREAFSRLPHVSPQRSEHIVAYLSPWLSVMDLKAMNRHHANYVLVSLLIFSLKFGVIYEPTVNGAWQSLAIRPSNIELVVEALIAISARHRNRAFITLARKIVFFLASRDPDTTVSHLVSELQHTSFCMELDTAAIPNKTHARPSASAHQPGGSTPPKTAPPSGSHIAAKKGIRKRIGGVGNKEALNTESHALAAGSAEEDPLVGIWDIHAALPAQPLNHPFSRAHISLALIAEVSLLDRTAAALTAALPTILHASFMSADSSNPFTREFSFNLMYHLIQALLIACPAASAELRKDARSLQHLLETTYASPPHVGLWQYEDITPLHQTLASTAVLATIARRITALFASLAGGEAFSQSWASEALGIALISPASPHTSSRCLQVYRALQSPPSPAHWAQLLRVLEQHLQSPTEQFGLGIELLLTLRSALGVSARVGQFSSEEIQQQVFWAAVLLLLTDDEREFDNALLLLEELLDILDLTSPATIERLLVHLPTQLPKPFRGIQPYLLKGVTSPITAEATHRLLLRFSAFPPASNALIDPSATRIHDAVLGMLPQIYMSAQTPSELTSIVNALATLTEHTQPDLHFALLQIARHSTPQSIQSMSRQFFQSFLPVHHFRTLSILVEMLAKGSPHLRLHLLTLIAQLLSVIESGALFAQFSDLRANSFALYDKIYALLDTPELGTISLAMCECLIRISESVKTLRFFQVDSSPTSLDLLNNCSHGSPTWSNLDRTRAQILSIIVPHLDSQKALHPGIFLQQPQPLLPSFPFQLGDPAPPDVYPVDPGSIAPLQLDEEANFQDLKPDHEEPEPEQPAVAVGDFPLQLSTLSPRTMANAPLPDSLISSSSSSSNQFPEKIHPTSSSSSLVSRRAPPISPTTPNLSVPPPGQAPLDPITELDNSLSNLVSSLEDPISSTQNHSKSPSSSSSSASSSSSSSDSSSQDSD